MITAQIGFCLFNLCSGNGKLIGGVFTKTRINGLSELFCDIVTDPLDFQTQVDDDVQ